LILDSCLHCVMHFYCLCVGFMDRLFYLPSTDACVWLCSCTCLLCPSRSVFPIFFFFVLWMGPVSRCVCKFYCVSVCFPLCMHALFFVSVYFSSFLQLLKSHKPVFIYSVANTSLYLWWVKRNFGLLAPWLLDYIIFVLFTIISELWPSVHTICYALFRTSFILR
jgi:hypothetical protein